MNLGIFVPTGNNGWCMPSAPASNRRWPAAAMSASRRERVQAPNLLRCSLGEAPKRALNKRLKCAASENPQR